MRIALSPIFLSPHRSTFDLDDLALLSQGATLPLGLVSCCNPYQGTLGGRRFLVHAGARYTECPDPQFWDPDAAVALMKHAIAPDVQPVYLTILVLAYSRIGKIEKAVTAEQVLESLLFPPGSIESTLGPSSIPR